MPEVVITNETQRPLFVLLIHYQGALKLSKNIFPGKYWIGRAKENEIQLEMPDHVEQRHAVITCTSSAEILLTAFCGRKPIKVNDRVLAPREKVLLNLSDTVFFCSKMFTLPSINLFFGMIEPTVVTPAETADERLARGKAEAKALVHDFAIRIRNLAPAEILTELLRMPIRNPSQPDHGHTAAQSLWIARNQRDFNYYVWKELAAVPGMIAKIRRHARTHGHQALADGLLCAAGEGRWAFTL